MSPTLNHPARSKLAPLAERLFLTDGGLETSLIFHEGWDLPCFASFPLVETDLGRKALKAYYERYIALAHARDAGFLLEAATWRANPDWGAKLGYDQPRLEAANRENVALLAELRWLHSKSRTPMLLSGCIGPRGDGYDAGKAMTEDEAQAYHGWQAQVLADAGVDMITAMTMTNIPEAVGVARAIRETGLPAVISFTVETDGRLPSGDTLKAGIKTVDAAAKGAVAYFMINCAHPTHFESVLEPGTDWTQRIGGLRANASRCSHAELDNAPALDIGDPLELGREYARLVHRFPHVRVIGGCCGTDHRHVEAIGAACFETV